MLSAEAKLEGEHMSTQQNAPMFQVQQRPCGVTLMGLFLLMQGAFLIAVGIFGLIGIVVIFFDVSKGGGLLAHGLISGILGILKRFHRQLSRRLEDSLSGSPRICRHFANAAESDNESRCRFLPRRGAP
jgi:hypothetical protein